MTNVISFAAVICMCRKLSSIPVICGKSQRTCILSYTFSFPFYFEIEVVSSIRYPLIIRTLMHDPVIVFYHSEASNGL
jgi:hypothetical protein